MIGCVQGSESDSCPNAPQLPSNWPSNTQARLSWSDFCGRQSRGQSKTNSQVSSQTGLKVRSLGWNHFRPNQQLLRIPSAPHEAFASLYFLKGSCLPCFWSTYHLHQAALRPSWVLRPRMQTERHNPRAMMFFETLSEPQSTGSYAVNGMPHCTKPHNFPGRAAIQVPEALASNARMRRHPSCPASSTR